MKRQFVHMLCLVCLVSVSICLFAACESEHIVAESERSFGYTIEEKYWQEGMTLLSYMDIVNNALGEQKKEYIFRDGMLVSVDGVEGASNEYWMLYTDDPTYSNDAWGKLLKDGKYYYSAICGAEELPVKLGCSYIWCLQEV